MLGAEPALEPVEFQSLFFWKWGFKQKRLHRPKGLKPCFNPCFSGSGVLRAKSRGVSPGTVGSFNPCFSGSGVLSHNWLILCAAPFLFQSLFFWKWGFKRIFLKRMQKRKGVSILVFLEVGF